MLLEAGPAWYATKDSKMLVPEYASPRRGGSTKTKPFGEFDGCIGGWEIAGEPYTRAPGTTFDWWRARMLGGRTNHWGRISLRFGPDDFRGKSRDGLGDDWPIAYDDLAPYYDRVDELIGVFGSIEGLPNHPDGNFLPPPKPRCYELLIKQACDELASRASRRGSRSSRSPSTAARRATTAASADAAAARRRTSRVPTCSSRRRSRRASSRS